jgi:hypothetical protein
MCYVSFKNENNNNIVHNRFQVSGMIVHYCKQDIFVKFYLQNIYSEDLQFITDYYLVQKYSNKLIC